MTVANTKQELVILPLGPAQALALVMAEMPAIGKDQKAPEKMGGFKFRGIEDITAVLQALLSKHGVITIPGARITDVRPARPEGWSDVYVQCDWKIYGPDGTYIEAQTCGIGRDGTDKGATKAMTQAYKYLLIQMLCISDPSDDGDAHDYGQAVVERTPVEVFWEKLKAHSADEIGEAMRAIAAQDEKPLIPRQLEQDADWLAKMSAELDRLITNQEAASG